MKRFILLTTFAVLLLGLPAFASGGDKETEDEILRKSALFEANPFLFNTSYPRVFTEVGNSISQAAVSTGYYFVDSKDEAQDYWRPVPNIYPLADESDGAWKKVVTGPRQVDPTWWDDPANVDGKYFSGILQFQLAVVSSIVLQTRQTTHLQVRCH